MLFWRNAENVSINATIIFACVEWTVQSQAGRRGKESLLRVFVDDSLLQVRSSKAMESAAGIGTEHKTGTVLNCEANKMTKSSAASCLTALY